VARDANGYNLQAFDQATGAFARAPLNQPRVQLRVDCDFDTEIARFSYSTDGSNFKPLGGEVKTVFQLKTFQGVRYALFHYNTSGNPGGYADYDDFSVFEPRPRGLTRPIPIGRSLTLLDLATGNVLAIVDGKLHSVSGADRAAAFRVIERGTGRIALQTGGRYISVVGAGRSGEVTLKSRAPGDAETFQWVDLQRGETLLLSLSTHRYIVAPQTSGAVAADHPGPTPDRRDGSCFSWKIVGR
jgi:hypothetical protein